MAKFYGKVGYAETTETATSVFTEVITERSYYGDVTRYTRRLENSGGVNDNVLMTSNVISIVADAEAMNHFFAIRYVCWNGARWKVDNVEVLPPRLILTLGGVYNGPTPHA